MHVLALDTTTRALTAALVRDDRVIHETRGDPGRSQAEQLPGALVRLLDAAGLDARAIDLFAVAAGPGSFTGLRVGIATMQGLAFAAGRPLALISALEALAHAGSADLTPGALIGSWMDAHRSEVFSALYRVEEAPGSAGDRLSELVPPTVASPADTLARWVAGSGRPAVIIGDGAVAFAEIIGDASRVLPAPPLAPTIARLAARAVRRGSSAPPHAAQPLYVRRPDAEIAREKQQARHEGLTRR